jgi:protein-disulfide isomerase
MMTTPEKKPDYMELRIPKLQLNDSPINTVLALTLAICTFLLGMLFNKVQFLEKQLKENTTQQTAQTAQPQPEPTEDPRPKQVSVDDDPVLGLSDAKVTIIEFSDYECPFCKRYFDQTYPQIVKEYVDTGKVKIVYRDLPLSFHDPMATLEAVAANCARAQGDDQTYFAYHDELFKRTKSNGNGLTEADLSTIASDLGLNLSEFSTCLADAKNKEEVVKDLADASTVGATGTPTFFIGKTTPSGTILGTKLVGAQPLEAFKKVIDEELKK